MIEIITHEINAHDDFELNIKRENKLIYHMTINKEKRPDGIIFVIPGFGEDASLKYQENILSHITKEYNLLAVFVEYHALFARPTNGATVKFDPIDTELLIDVIQKYNIQLDKNNLSFYAIAAALDEQLPNKAVGVLSATLFPNKNEYQNFGILQAIDILTVLYHLKYLGHNKLIEKSPIIAVGSSHGGYIANLLTKLAPNTFDLIVDNSCYTKPPLQYIVGKEDNITKAEYALRGQKFTISGFTATYWTKNEKSPYYFSKSAYEIRDLTNKSHNEVKINTYHSKTTYISYHSKFDYEIAPYNEKVEYVFLLKSLGANYQFHTIHSEDQIDRKFIKNLDHAMGASNKELIKNTIPSFLEKYSSSIPTDLANKSNISYDTSENNQYLFNFNENNFTAKFKKHTS